VEKFKTFPATIYRYCEPTPTLSGFALDPNEFELIETRLNPNKKESKNNHHGCHAKRKFGCLAIFQTCRDLEFDQFPMFIDQHDWWHATHEEPPLPTLQQAMDRCEAAYEWGERLRIGSLNNPQYKEFTEGRIIKLRQEYNDNAQIKIVSYHQ